MSIVRANLGAKIIDIFLAHLAHFARRPIRDKIQHGFCSHSILLNSQVYAFTKKNCSTPAITCFWRCGLVAPQCLVWDRQTILPRNCAALNLLLIPHIARTSAHSDIRDKYKIFQLRRMRILC